MKQCSCIALPKGQQLLLSLTEAPALLLCLINQQKNRVLMCQITPKSTPKPLSALFPTLQALYTYLSEPNSEITVSDESANITLHYQMQTIFDQKIETTVQLPTQAYFPLIPKIEQNEPKELSPLPLPSKRSLVSEKETVMEGEYNLNCTHNKEEMGSKVMPLQGHPGWYRNKCPVFLILGTLQKKLCAEERITNRININLRRFHPQGEDATNRYDLTLGTADTNAILQLKHSQQEDFDKLLSNTVSVTVRGRRITCHCLNLKEQFYLESVVSPESLQLYVTQKIIAGKGLKTVCIEMFLNQHRLINVFEKEALTDLQERLDNLEDFMSFVRLQRSELHFSLTHHSRSVILVCLQTSSTIVHHIQQVHILLGLLSHALELSLNQLPYL